MAGWRFGEAIATPPLRRCVAGVKRDARLPDNSDNAEETLNTPARYAPQVQGERLPAPTGWRFGDVIAALPLRQYIATIKRNAQRPGCATL